MFRLCAVGGRSALDVDGWWFDLATLAGDDGLADPMRAVARTGELHKWNDLATERDPSSAGGSVHDTVLGPPVPRPGQVFGIGLNYADHLAETGAEAPPAPLTFTKFPSSISGPTDDIPLSGAMVDWEVELVVVVGTPCTRVPAHSAWEVVAGLTLGQDVSDRKVQLTGSPPQFSLGKSFAGFSPIGPALVSVDAFADPDDIGLRCVVDGEVMQDGRTSSMLFGVPALVSYLSSICTLAPGDLIFTGTPAGVGMGRNRFLAEGEVVVSTADGIGGLRNRCIAGTGPLAL